VGLGERENVCVYVIVTVGDSVEESDGDNVSVMVVDGDNVSVCEKVGV
jgi:hypothetical protein